MKVGRRGPVMLARISRSHPGSPSAKRLGPTKPIGRAGGALAPNALGAAGPAVRHLLIGCLPWLLIAVAVSPAAAVVVTGAEVVQQAQARLARCRTLSARFEKRFYWAALDRTSTFHGHLYLRRPDRFRVEVDDGNLVIADGKAIWVYNRKNAQAVANSYSGQIRSPWEVLVDFQSAQAPGSAEQTSLGGRPCYLVTLVPRVADGNLARTRVWIGQRDSLLLQVEQLDITDDLTTYTLQDQRTNGALADRLFRFQPPAGTEVIDRRGPVGAAE